MLMVRISTPVLGQAETVFGEVSQESLGEDDERLYSALKLELNKNFGQPEDDTIRFILSYSKFLQKKRN